MNQLPSSLTRRTPQWWMAIALTVLSDLSGMLAAFMPVKAILVLASGSVPAFFPDVLANGGTFVATVALLFAAGAFAVLALLGHKIAEHLDHQHSKLLISDSLRVYWRREEQVWAENERGFTTSITLITVIVILLSFVSMPFLLFLTIWILSSGLWIAVRVLRSPRSAPYESGVDQFSHQFAGWLKTTALWAVVLIALVTLLIVPPALGATAILIAVIFGRRLTVAIAAVAPDAVTRGASRVSDRGFALTPRLINHLPQGKVGRQPVVYLSSAVGRDHVNQELDRMGADCERFRVLSSASVSPSIVALGPDHSQFLIRLFGVDAEDDRKYEALVRRSMSGVIFPQASSIKFHVFAGFPAIVLTLDDPRAMVKSKFRISEEMAARFQVTTEVASMSELSVVSIPLGIHEDWLANKLTRLTRLPGKHVELCQRFIQRIPCFLGQLNTLPAAVTPSSFLRPNQLYESEDGTICYLGGNEWSIGRLGDSWGHPRIYEQALRDSLKEDAANDAMSMTAAVLNAEIRWLIRALDRFDLEGCNRTLKRIESRFS